MEGCYSELSLLEDAGPIGPLLRRYPSQHCCKRIVKLLMDFVLFITEQNPQVSRKGHN